jgi:hypothetical protein
MTSKLGRTEIRPRPATTPHNPGTVLPFPFRQLTGGQTTSLHDDLEYAHEVCIGYQAKA